MSADDYLTHVADIEYTDVLAHCLVLINNICVLDRHVETAKRLNQSSESDMLVI
jgi:hypothetical protein